MRRRRRRGRRRPGCWPTHPSSAPQINLVRQSRLRDVANYDNSGPQEPSPLPARLAAPGRRLADRLRGDPHQGPPGVPEHLYPDAGQDRPGPPATLAAVSPPWLQICLSNPAYFAWRPRASVGCSAPSVAVPCGSSPSLTKLRSSRRSSPISGSGPHKPTALRNRSQHRHPVPNHSRTCYRSCYQMPRARTNQEHHRPSLTTEFLNG